MSPVAKNARLTNSYYGYTGEMHDIEGRMLYLRARYYDFNTSQFMQQDTVLGDIKEPLTRNLYLYGKGNPLTYVDPSGHRAVLMEAVDGGGGYTFNLYEEVQKLYKEVEKLKQPYKKDPYNWTNELQYKYLTIYTASDNILPWNKKLHNTLKPLYKEYNYETRIKNKYVKAFIGGVTQGLYAGIEEEVADKLVATAIEKIIKRSRKLAKVAGKEALELAAKETGEEVIDKVAKETGEQVFEKGAKEVGEEALEKGIKGTDDVGRNPLDIVKETDMFVDYMNESGTVIRDPKQTQNSIADSISKNLSSADIGVSTEAKVADFINKNTDATITDFGNKIKSKNGNVLGDIDVATENILIEVKASISSVKEKQLYKYIDSSKNTYLNTGNKQVILYIDETIDMTNLNNVRLVEKIKNMGITIINNMNELKGVTK
ncbi:RHS repeat-associated core domain-containing protein [Oceanirhabdus sp. W0125-5]|uniref:RHS repeat-associated core domain-containing protein n=1 Tax=Oceanirhabdus sp. W0125-5 TaxID=2999116 RepID=UPI0022F315EE|nr:RHS repeat-associated core domain-containing protein [Oceanirhabdus sp. W0125-5]WBW99795.1 hypothetical protein OW730_20875 [Oceanirhabdus sp. W0125-5]